jgi:hypothetical protein
VVQPSDPTPSLPPQPTDPAALHHHHPCRFTTWPYLAQLTGLQELGLRRCEGAALASGFSSITGLRELQRLDMSGCNVQVRAPGLPRLGCCTALLPAQSAVTALCVLTCCRMICSGLAVVHTQVSHHACCQVCTV